jgi:hypothetical protein
MSICEKCGHDIQIGQWPYCKGSTADHIGPIHGFEDPLEPYVDEHIAKHPVEIRTRGERRKLMAQQNIEYRKPKPGKRLFFDMRG